ncbi:hypothetical protein J4E81_005825 [Alternaria sp. BMP 2799]|nr:hypothetical protein J4E81_005825 [Alternaria sp. BMP 2799]
MARREDQGSRIGSTLLNSCISDDKQGRVNVTAENIVRIMTVGGGRTWVRVAVILEEILTSGPPRMIDGTIDSDPIPRTVGNVIILGVNAFNNRVVNTDENNTLQPAHDRATHSPPSSRNNRPPNLEDIEEVIAASKFALFKKPDCNKPVVGFNVVYEGEDEKTDLIDSNSVQVGDIWEIHEMGPTGNRDAFLGDGKTTPSSGGLHSSKTTRIVVTGGTGERRTGFRITSCNNTLQEKIKKSGEVSRYFLIHVQGRPPPSNTAGLPTLRVSSSAYWMAFSAMDTENIVTFRPDNIMRLIGRAHIADVQRAVQQRSQQDIIGVSTLAQTFQATNPYGLFPPSSSLSNSAVANPTPPGVQPAQPLTAHPSFNPPTGPRAEFRRSDRLRTQPPPDYRDTGRRQGATGPASQPAPQTITHPPPARPPLPSEDQAVQGLRGATNGRSPAQRFTETGQPRTNGTDTKRKRDDSEDGPRKNRRRDSN